MIRDPALLPLIQMRWEKLTDFDATFLRPIGLRLAGEYAYRAYLESQGRTCVIPKAENGTASFLLRLFTAYRIRVKEAEERWELFRLYKDVSLARYVKHESASDPFENLLVLFWKAQRILNPAAVRPFGKVADQLVEDMKANKAVFENPEGLKIAATD